MWKREKDILWALKKALADKSHPNVCRLAWVCEVKRTIALEPLMPSPSPLSKWMSRNEGLEEHSRVLTNQQRLGIVEKVADALRFLHKRNFSHNDIQPSNIVLGPCPKDDVLLVDFGLACNFSRDARRGVVAAQPRINTPLRYAPPEVLKETVVAIRGEVR